MVFDDLIEEQELTSWLAQHDGWQIKALEGAPALYRCLSLNSFSCPMHLANQIAVTAEQYDHHPQLTLAWGKLEIYWTSHDAKGITHRDLSLAVLTDRVLQEVMRRMHAA